MIDYLFDIVILTADGKDIRKDRIYNAWLIGSLQPGSVIPKWMLESDLNKRKAYFAKARAEAHLNDGWDELTSLQAAITYSRLQWEEWVSARQTQQLENQGE